MRIVIGLLLALACGHGVLAQERVSAAARETATQNGHARVLVMLQDTPDKRVAVSAAKLPARRQAVQARVDRVLGDVGLGTGPSVLRRFEVVPAVVLHADPSMLDRLARHPGVRRVDIDAGGGGHAVAPDAASVLNNLHALVTQGFAGQGMKVAVIDSGIDLAHPDLAPALVAQQCYCAGPGGAGGCCPNGLAQQSGAGAARDDHGHGTNVAGIIVGRGIVAPRGALPEASLVAVRVIDAENRFCCTSDIVAALDWVAAHHPDVDAVNLSLGTDALFPSQCDAQHAAALAMAASVATLNGLGAVVTASTGNQGNLSATALPACLRDVMGVAATWDGDLGSRTVLGCTDSATAARKPTCFSNRSPTTDLFAAGAFVTSTGRNGGVSTYAGTSQAAPMVAACAVALKQAVPVATLDQRMDAIRLSLSRIADTETGRVYPFLDCGDAVRLLDPAQWKPLRSNGAQPLRPPG